MVFEENFIRLTVTACLQKNECFKNVIFLTLFFSHLVIITWLLDNIFTFKDLLSFKKNSTLIENLVFLVLFQDSHLRCTRQ